MSTTDDLSEALAAQHVGIGELRAGNLGLRIARADWEIDAAQALRYRVFYEEMGALTDPVVLASGRDRDAYDAVADHLLVVDHDLGDGRESVVGTYRLIRESAAKTVGRFYTAGEYDIGVLERFPGRYWNLAGLAWTAPIAGARRCNCYGAASPPISSSTTSISCSAARACRARMPMF